MAELLAGVGAILLAAGILGGGLEMQQVKIPRIGFVIRVVSTVTGALLVLLAVGMFFEGRPDAAPSTNAGTSPVAPTVPAPVVQRPVDFEIVDELGDGQISEQVAVQIDGRRVGQITVDVVHPRSALTVTVPKADRYSYALQATAAFNDRGRPVIYTGTGQGMINVTPGGRFNLEGAISGNTWMVQMVN